MDRKLAREVRDSMDANEPSSGGWGYPSWFRARALAYFDSLSGNTIEDDVQATSGMFRVAARTLWRWLALRNATGSLTRLPTGGGRVCKMPAVLVLLLMLYTVAYPDVTHIECIQIAGVFFPGIALYERDISRLYKRLDITRKRVRKVAAELNLLSVELWHTYPPPIGCVGLNVHRLIDLDESYVYLTSGTRNYGYAFIGEEAKVTARFVRGTKYTLILAVSTAGVVCHWLLKDQNTTTQVFSEFLEFFLLPKLHGAAPHHVMWDNLSSHTSPAVESIITRAGHTVLPRPPYYPACAPVEVAFRLVKDELRRQRFALTPATLPSVIRAGLRNVTAAKMLAVYRHCGYR